jgi:hypothetical protein
MVLASVLVAQQRVLTIFESHMLSPRRLTDNKMMPRFLALQLVNVVLLVAWINSRGPGTTRVLGVDGVLIEACNYGNTVALVLWLMFFMGFVVLNAVTAIRLWCLRVPDKFSESVTLLAVALFVMFICMVGIPLVLIASTEKEISSVKFTLCLFFAVFSTVLYFVPKLYLLRHPPVVSTRTFRFIKAAEMLPRNPSIRTPRKPSLPSLPCAPLAVIVTSEQGELVTDSRSPTMPNSPPTSPDQ